MGENVGMDFSSELEVGGRREGMEEEREGVEVGSNALQSHAKVYGGRGGKGKRSCGSSMGSDESVPNEGIEGGMGKVERRVG